MDNEMRLTKQQFIGRFSQSETTAILSAAKVSVDVEAWLFRFDNLTPDADGTAIDTSENSVITGVEALEAAGLLEVGRASEILNINITTNTPTVSLLIGQQCAKEPEWAVVSGGTYSITEPVEVTNGKGAFCAYQANYITYGEFA